MTLTSAKSLTVVVLRSGVPADTKPKTWVWPNAVKPETLKVARALAPKVVAGRPRWSQGVTKVVVGPRSVGVPSCLDLPFGVPSCHATKIAELWTAAREGKGGSRGGCWL